MKLKNCFLLALCATVLLANCKKGDAGPKGDSGNNSLVRTSQEAAGANCSTGGMKIETGIDVNGNGTLDAAEVNASQIRYICDGVTGSTGANGQTTLTKTTLEPAGANCAAGGVKIEVGQDANGNGTLDATEIVTAMTRYICNGVNGANGLNSLVRTTTEPAGANCTYGGTKFETGLDANRNGILENVEVITSQTKYVCDGAASVIYSGWIDINVVANDNSDAAESNFPYKQVINAPALSADIVDKGVVLMYYKNSRGTVFPVDRDDVYPIIDFDGSSAVGIRTGYTFKVNRLSFLAVALSNSNIDAMNNNGAAIRYVLVPGSVQGRATTDLKKMSYDEIAQLFNIRD